MAIRDFWFQGLGVQGFRGFEFRALGFRALGVYTGCRVWGRTKPVASWRKEHRLCSRPPTPESLAQATTSYFLEVLTMNPTITISRDPK